MLPVQVHHFGRDFPKQGNRCRRVIDERPTMGRTDFPSQDEMRQHIDSILGKQRVQTLVLGSLEFAFDHGFSRTRSNGLHGGPITQDQFECAHHNRLSRTRFPRDDVESGVELDFQLLDEGEITDVQPSQHGRRNAAR